MTSQTLSQKSAEIRFRKKLMIQFRGIRTTYPLQPTQSEFVKIILERMQLSRSVFAGLRAKHIPVTPFLEIGAERGQRALLLTNEFEAHGFALDISRESLEAAPAIAQKYHYQKCPFRICSDTYHLPFPDNCLAFVFCFQTLHHFPDPVTVIKEINRVLTPGGYFFFGEEPVKQKINLDLWKRDYHLKFWEGLLKKTGLLLFLSTIGRSETDEGILETTFDFSTWKKVFEIFDNSRVLITPFAIGPNADCIVNSRKSFKVPQLTSLFTQLFGGGIEGLCQKRGKIKISTKKALRSYLVCPTCHNALISKKSRMYCNSCSDSFPLTNGVFMLLPKKLRRKLYP